MNKFTKLSASVLLATTVSIAGGAVPAHALEVTNTSIGSPQVSMPSNPGLAEVDFSGENYQINIDDTLSSNSSNESGIADWLNDSTSGNVEFLLNVPKGAKAGDTRTIKSQINGTIYPNFFTSSEQFINGDIVDAEGNVAATIEWGVQDGYDRTMIGTITYTDWVETHTENSLLIKTPVSSAPWFSDLKVAVDGEEHVIKGYFLENNVYDPNSRDASFFGRIGAPHNEIRFLSPILGKADTNKEIIVSYSLSSDNEQYLLNDKRTSVYGGNLYSSSKGDDPDKRDYIMRHEVRRPDSENEKPKEIHSDSHSYSFSAIIPDPSDYDEDLYTAGVEGDFVRYWGVYNTNEIGQKIPSYNSTSETPYTWNDNVFTLDVKYEWNGKSVEKSQRFVGPSITARAYGTPVPTTEADTTTTAFNKPTNIDILKNDTASTDVKEVILVDNEGNRADTITVDGEGTWTLNDDGTVTFVPVAGFTGQVSPVSYIVIDSNGGESAPAEISLTVSEAAVPVSNDDTVTVKTDSTVNIDVLKNDVLNEDGATWDKVSLVDENNNKVDTLTTSAGTFTVNADNTITFTAKEGYVGDVSAVKYVATDSNGKEATGSISVEVADFTSPVVNPDTMTGKEGTTLTVKPLDNDVLKEEGTTWSNVKIVDKDGNHVDTLTTSEGVYTVNADHTVTFVPTDAFTGTTTPVKYVATDSNGKTGESTITFEVTANTPPVEETPKTVVTDDNVKIDLSKGNTTTVDILDNDVLQDGDVVALDKLPSDFPGTVTLNADNTVTIILNDGVKIGDLPEITYTVTSENGTTYKGSIKISVVNTTPQDEDNTPPVVVDTDQNPKNPDVIVDTKNPVVDNNATTVVDDNTAKNTTKNNDGVLVKTGEVVKNSAGALGAGLLGLGTILGTVFGVRRFKKNN